MPAPNPDLLPFPGRAREPSGRWPNPRPRHFAGGGVFPYLGVPTVNRRRTRPAPEETLRLLKPGLLSGIALERARLQQLLSTVHADSAVCAVRLKGLSGLPSGKSAAAGDALGLAGALAESGRLFAHPTDKGSDVVVREQRVDRAIVGREFNFGEQCVDLPVTDAMHERGMHATSRAWHQMVGVPLGFRNDTPAQRAIRKCTLPWRKLHFRNGLATDTPGHDILCFAQGA